MSPIEATLSRRALVAASTSAGVLGTWPAHSQSKSMTMDTTIRVDDAVTTRVSVFTVEPEEQPKLLALLVDSIDPLVNRMPGWISSSYLISKDRRQILVYSQWRDEKDLQAVGQNPELKPYLQQVAAMAKLTAFTCDVSHASHA